MQRPRRRQRRTTLRPRKVAIAAALALMAGCTTGNSTQAVEPLENTTTTLRSDAPITTVDQAASTTTADEATTTSAPATTTSEATPATPSTTLPGVDAGGVTFTQLDLGAEPRQLLRYDVEAGTQTYAAIESQTLIQDIEGLPNPNEVASSLRTELSTEVTPRDGGSFDLVTSTLDVVAGDDTAASIGAADVLREPLRSIVTTTTVSDRGVKLAASSTGLEALAALGPQFETLVNDPPDAAQGSIPLPVEAVGVGARWTVASDQSVSGFRVVESLTFEIVSIEPLDGAGNTGFVVQLTITGTQISNSQDVENPGVPNSTISVDVWDIDITGEATVSTNRFVNPISQVVSGQQILTVTQGALESSVDQTLTSTIEVRPN